MLIFFNVKSAVSLLDPIKKWKYARPFFSALEIVDNYRFSILLLAGMWAVLRYITFSCQYVLLLYFLGIDLHPD